jgi:3-hydroxyisobutyrate dehydrogenase/2-hydroxy-3-oxopropionate reductase
VERELAYEVFANSAVAAPFVGYKRAAYVHPESAPVAFALDLVAKDLDLAAALAGGVGAPIPQLETNRRVVGEAIDAGLGAADLSAIARHLRG